MKFKHLDRLQWKRDVAKLSFQTIQKRYRLKILSYRHGENGNKIFVFTHGQPGSCRARPVNVEYGHEDIRWIRGLASEKLPAASYALLPYLKRVYFCHRRGIENFCRLFSTQQRPNVFLSTPGRRPPRITGRSVNTVTRGWVGAPNERAPFRFHGAVVVFVNRCLSRTRNLAASN